MKSGENPGLWGEERAARYLRRHGYRIVERNFSCRSGEIDIIAEKGDILAFVEVKLRKDDSHGAAREFVTYRKQQRLMSTASLWLARNETDRQPRLDVIEIYAPHGRLGNVTVNHLEDAFSAD